MSRTNSRALTYQVDAQGINLLCLPDGARYTGIVYEAVSTGYITSEYEVKNGLKDGVEKVFYTADEVEQVAHYRQGFLHGEVVYYYPGGGQKEKAVFAYNICLEEFEWAATGELTHHRVLALLPYQQVLLEDYRQQFGQ